MNTTDTSMLDKVAGVIVIAMSFCGICMGLGMVGLGGLLGVAGIAGAGSGGVPAAAVGGLMGILGFVFLTIAALNIASGVGIFQSRRWGFVLACVLTGIGFLISLAGTDGFMSTIPSLLVFVYCLMRLLGKIGEPPV